MPISTKPFFSTDRLVPPEGPKSAEIVIIGEAPGEKEAKFLKPFYAEAPTGGLLNQLLQQAEINRADCWITNVIKQRPLNNRVSSYISYNSKTGVATKTPQYEEFEASLFQELDSLPNKKVIVCMGNVSLYALTGKWGILKYRGSILWSEKASCKVVACIHPAKALREYIFRHTIIHDLKRAKAQSAFPEIRRVKRTYLLNPTYEQVMNFLNKILENKKPVAFDIEVLREEVSHLSFSQDPLEAISIDFFRNNKNAYTPEQEANILLGVEKILSSPSIRKIGQNLEFDTTFFFENYGIVSHNLDDTMIAHKIIFPDFKAGLGFIASTYTEEPYYKDEGKSYMKIGGDDLSFSKYNANDSIICAEAMPLLKKDLELQGNLETYRSQVELIQPLSFMSSRGIRTDVEGVHRYREKLKEEIESLGEELNTLCGKEINVKGDSLKNYFYIEKNIKPYLKKGRPTLDESSLIRLKRRGFKEADLALQIRKKRTIVEKYLNIKFKEGRFVCSYNPVGTNTGRLSSSKQIITDYGTNAQNIPHALDEYFLADEGYIIGNVDLSQADNRTVAYISPEPRMIQAFEDGTDVHSLTASMMFDIPIDEIIEMNKKGIPAPIGNRDRTHRKWGKECNHGLNYDLGYKTFSFRLEIPESEGKLLHSKYHQIYPNIKQRFHTQVQAQLRAGRTLTNPFGRKFLFLDRWGDELFKQAYAFIPQSTTADIINRWGLNEFYYNTQKFQEVELLRQVHDSINFQIPLSIGLEKIAQILKGMKESLERPLHYRNQTWVIPAEFSLGFNLKDQTEINFHKPLLSQLQDITNAQGR